MGIKSANKRGKIGKKLILSYMLVLIIAFLVVGITFKVFMTNFLLSQAKQELKREGERIAETLSHIPFQRERIQERLSSNKSLRILGRHIDAGIIVLDNDYKVLYTSFNNSDKGIVSKIRNQKEAEKRGYVVVRTPIEKKGRTMGLVALVAEVKELKGLNRIRFSMLMISFLIAAVVALIVSMFFERSLVKPIMKLRNEINRFSIKEFKEIDIKTNDEIEELAGTFNSMARKLKGYDQQQRRFLQNASHELKTPLMSIQGYAEGIKDGVIEGDEVQESLDIIIDESQRLKKLVEQIIYLTRLENAGEVFELKEADINEIAESAIKSVKALAIDTDIDIEIETDGKGFGYYDVEKMKRVFINLVGNAIRYAQKRILVSIRDMGNYKLIEVIDDGAGFKNGEDKKIFERFYKGEKGGSGIGLAITRAIVKGHNGTISAYNHEELGAVFKIELKKTLREEK